MKNLSFVQLQKENEEHYNLFVSLMIPYNKELCEHRPEYPVTNENVPGITKGILNMQGPHDRHLELCYDGDVLIGFLYGKVDHKGHKGFIKPEYGYIMEFYVKPEYRRKGYSRAMFERLESLFAKHGAHKMYLTADPVTGEPFWKAMGFEAIGDISPENGLLIFEKDVHNTREIITILINDYLTNELATNIAMAQWHSDLPEWVNRIRRANYDDKYFNDCFHILATNNNQVIGRIYCTQNENDPKLWYYGDLFVIPEYHRLGISKRMIKAAISRLSELGAKTLRTYVSPENTASLHLQKSVGFIEKQFEKFNLLINDGEIMFELEIPSLFNVIPATADEAVFIKMFYQQNIDILHGKQISLDEWKEILQKDDPDEQNFLICKGCMPIGWLRVNGLLNKDIAWLSMLAVSDKHHHQGIGKFSVEFAEKFAKDKGLSKIGIHTTDDNIPAQNLYKKCGYIITNHGKCTTGDGVKRLGYTFKKELK